MREHLLWRIRDAEAGPGPPEPEEEPDRPQTPFFTDPRRVNRRREMLSALKEGHRLGR